MTTRTKSKSQKSDAPAKPATQKYFDTKVFFIDGRLSIVFNKKKHSQIYQQTNLNEINRLVFVYSRKINGKQHRRHRNHYSTKSRH